MTEPPVRRPRPKRRHPAQGARIAAAGLGATIMLGLVGFMGYRSHPAGAASPTAAPSEQVPVDAAGAPAGAMGSGGGSDAVTPGGTTAPTATATLEARPHVRPAPPQTQSPTASTHGSN